MTNRPFPNLCRILAILVLAGMPILGFVIGVNQGQALRQHPVRMDLIVAVMLSYLPWMGLALPLYGLAYITDRLDRIAQRLDPQPVPADTVAPREKQDPRLTHVPNYAD